MMVCELHTKFRSEDVNGKDNLEDVGADEWNKFILKVIRLGRCGPDLVRRSIRCCDWLL